MKNFYNARNDKVFKAIFLDPADTELLEKLLSLILGKEVKNIKFENSELLKRNVLERAKMCDFIAKVDDTIVHIELNSTYTNWLHFRNFNYFTVIINKHTEVSQKYDISPKYIHIDLTYGMNDKEKTKISDYKLQNKKQYKYVDNVIVYEYDMDKIKKTWYTEKNKRKRQLYYYLSKLDMNEEELETRKEDDEFMKKLKNKIRKLNEDKSFVSFLSREKDLEFQKNTLYDDGKAAGIKVGEAAGKEAGIIEGKAVGIIEGKALGIIEGKNAGTIEIAKRMLDMQTDINFISQATGLTKQELNSLMVH